MRPVLFVGQVGHDFNPTEPNSWFTELGFYGVLARTSDELLGELGQWEDNFCAAVVRDRATNLLAPYALEELWAREIIVPCLVHAVSEENHEGQPWSEVIDNHYKGAQFVQRGPDNWPRPALEGFLSTVP